MNNAMTVDLEDWFCVSNLNEKIPREQWHRCELRVERNTHRLLNLFEASNVKATFFALGWVAERVPHLLREIEQQGHEIGIHGYYHLQLTKISSDEFSMDLQRAVEAVRQCGVKQHLGGFRAPSFSITKQTMWAFPILEQQGFRYDSSVFPIGFHPDYGVSDAPLAPYHVTPSLVEFPLSCAEMFGQRLPCCGGAYFRLAPYLYTKKALRQCNAQGRPVIFYIHPWELDPGQPRIHLPFSKRIRHYYGLEHTEKKMRKLLKDFRFTTVREVLRYDV